MESSSQQFTPTPSSVKKRIYITGLTAVGKTKMSIALAKYLGSAEIVNSDSQQFYEQANVMTAKASAEEMDGVEHHLLSILPLTEKNFNVNKFVALAQESINQIEQRVR